MKEIVEAIRSWWDRELNPTNCRECGIHLGASGSEVPFCSASCHVDFLTRTELG